MSPFILVVIFFNLGVTQPLLIPFDAPDSCQHAAERFNADRYVHSAYCFQKD